MDDSDFGLGEYLALAVELKAHSRHSSMSEDTSFGIITIRCNIK